MTRLRVWLRAHLLEIAATAIAFVVYCSFSAGMLLRQSGAPHFVWQAEAFDHGRLSVRDPPNLNDWVLVDDHGNKCTSPRDHAHCFWEVSFPPFPAVLMMPFVALHGLQFNDVFFTVCFAAFNIGLFVWLLKRFREAKEHSRTDREIAMLVAFFAFGTVYFYTSIRGEVWFTAHVIGVTLTLIYIAASLRARAPIIAGLAFGCAAITRANLAFAFPFFLLEAVAPDGKLPPIRKWLDRVLEALPTLLRFALPGIIVLSLAFWMNDARFGKWSEFGHALLFNNRVDPDVAQYGLFNVHYLERNLRAAFLLLPQISWSPFRLGFDGHGISMFITTPLLLLVPWVRRRAKSLLALAVTAVIIALPSLLYMNDGWYQFGFRFSNDYLPYLFLILAVGGQRFGKLFTVLGLAGVVVSTWGAIAFGR